MCLIKKVLTVSLQAPLSARWIINPNDFFAGHLQLIPSQQGFQVHLKNQHLLLPNRRLEHVSDR